MNGYDSPTPEELEAAAERFTPGPDDEPPRQVNGAAAAGKPAAFLARPVGLLDARSIPPRRFVYGRHYQRRFFSVTVSPGGIGKSTVSLIEAVAMVTGRALLHDRPHEDNLRVWYVNAEDPRDEIERRLAAILMAFGIAPAEIADRLFITSGRDARITLAERCTKDGAPIEAAGAATLRSEIEANRIDVLILDPFARFHRLAENSNDEMNFVVDLLCRQADQAGVAIDAVHHTRKPAPGQHGGNEGDANMSRGASAVIDGSRSARTIGLMSRDDATRFGLPTERARWYVRMDSAKASMFPPAAEAHWLERESVHLPNGDNVGVLKVWTPPDTWDGVSPDKVNAILDAIEAGPEKDEHFTTGRQSPERWAGRVLMEMAARTEAQAAQILKAWLTASTPFLKEAKYRSPAQRKEVRGLFVIGRPGAAS